MTRLVRVVLPAAMIVFAVPRVMTAQALASGMQPAVRISVDRLEEMAFQNNPTLRQAQAELEAARGRGKQVAAWPNPVVGYSAEEVRTGEPIRGGIHGAFVEQSIVLGGKLARSRAVFDREIDQAQAAVAMQQQRIRTTIRVLYYEALTSERRVEVNERLAQLAVEAVQVTRQLFNVGAADRPDVLESEIEAARAQLQLNAARNHQFAVWRQIASATGSSELQPTGLTTTIEAAIPELDRAGVLSTLMERSPELQFARQGLARAQAVVSRARRETFPDLFLRGGAGYNRERADVLSGAPRAIGWQANFEAGVSIPLFNRNAGGISAARADESRASAEIRRLELVIEARLAGTFEDYLTSVHSAEVYKSEVLPRAEEAYRLYLARYREMAAAYPQVLVAQRTLFQMTDEYLMTVESAWRAALQLQGFLLDDALATPTRTGSTELDGATNLMMKGPRSARSGGER